MFFNKIASLKKAAMLGFVIAAFSTNGNAMNQGNEINQENVMNQNELLTYFRTF